MALHFGATESLVIAYTMGVSFEDFDGMLLNDSNDLSKWDLQSVVGYKINRAVCYPCNYFHSKYPNVGWSGGRMVYVMFYK